MERMLNCQTVVLNEGSKLQMLDSAIASPRAAYQCCPLTDFNRIVSGRISAIAAWSPSYWDRG
jgi:hypothetical protein